MSHKNVTTNTIIHKIAHVPTRGKDIANYFEYKIGNFQVVSMMKIKTSHTMFELKNLPGVVQELESLAIYSKQISLETIKTKVITTLFKSHSFFTRREDIVAELRARVLAHTGQESPLFVITPDYQTHLPLIDYNGNRLVIEQDTILVEAETKHADTILELFKKI